MKITFFGAAGEVTGSSSLVETGQYKILIDCGMFQGSDFNDAKNHNPLPFNPSELSHVFITHAHLDHTGRLPLLVKNGYSGHFYATAPTLELAELVMRDAHGIMLYNNQKFGKPILYDETDIAAVVAEGKRVEYGEAFVLGGATVIPTEVEESRNQATTRSLDCARDDSTLVDLICYVQTNYTTRHLQRRQIYSVSF